MQISHSTLHKFSSFLAELITAFLIKSSTLESDSLNKLFNELSIIIGLVSYELSKKQISDKISFGCERYESLSGLCNGVLLLSICLTNLCHAVQSFINVSGIDHPFLFIVFGVAYFFINIFDIIILNDYKSSFILNGVFVHIMLDFFNYTDSSNEMIITIAGYVFRDTFSKNN